MIILVLTLIVITFVLVFLALNSMTEEIPQASKKLTIQELEEQIANLKTESEKAKLDYQNIQAEIELLKKKEFILEEEFAKRRQYEDWEQVELEKIRTELIQVKEEILAKESQLEEKISLSLDLTKELKEKTEKLRILEQENKQMADKIKALEADIDGYTKEIERLNNIILDMRKKEQGRVIISDKEYNELKDSLQAKDEELKILQENQKISRQEIDRLRQELKTKDELITKLQMGGGVPRQEYEELKRKLEEAEQVLRILHGAE